MTDKTISEIAANCACFHLRGAARAVTQIYDDAFRELGLRGTQFTVLTALRLLGPTPLGILARNLSTDRTTLSRNLALLARDGLVRLESGADERQTIVVITKAGDERHQRAIPKWRLAQTRILEQLGTDSWAELRDQLRALEQLA